MKRRTGWLIFLMLLPLGVRADILFKVGILNMESLTEKIPEAVELKAKWDKLLNKKYVLLQILEAEKEALTAKFEPPLLSEKLSRQSKILLLNQNIDRLKQEREKDLSGLKTAHENELKRKILLAIKSARRKKGFSMILSSKAELILHYDSKVDFNPMILEELFPKETEEAQD